MIEAPADTRPILLYDGECGLCDRTVQTILDLDREGTIRLAPLQGDTAREVLLRHGRDPNPPEGFESLIFVTAYGTPEERIREESKAVLGIGRSLGGRYRSMARLGELVPGSLRDVLYRLIARNRHRFFPAPEACRVPTPEVRERFLP